MDENDQRQLTMIDCKMSTLNVKLSNFEKTPITYHFTIRTYNITRKGDIIYGGLLSDPKEFTVIVLMNNVSDAIYSEENIKKNSNNLKNIERLINDYINYGYGYEISSFSGIPDNGNCIIKLVKVTH